MSISIGQQLGSYEITALLGKGGMGEVYRARNTKLKRDVAITTLPEDFSRDRRALCAFSAKSMWDQKEQAEAYNGAQSAPAYTRAHPTRAENSHTNNADGSLRDTVVFSIIASEWF